MAPTLNQKVLIWTRGRMGQQVGRGECWDLADQALSKSGANSSTTTGADDDYVWGDEIGIGDVIPGDILQFRDYEVTTTVPSPRIGRWRNRIGAVPALDDSYPVRQWMT
jgi:hypothetical protein